MAGLDWDSRRAARDCGLTRVGLGRTNSFVLSVTQTISNKYLLRGWYPFPWILTTTQLLFCTLGTMVAAQAGLYTPARVSPDRAMRLRFISILFSAELLCANVGLRMVSVPCKLPARGVAEVRKVAPDA